MVLHIEKLRSAYFANFQFSTSSKVGTEGAAPGLDTAIADALDARSNASFGLSPLLIADTKKPVNVSPAAVVSTAFTL